MGRQFVARFSLYLLIAVRLEAQFSAGKVPDSPSTNWKPTATEDYRSDLRDHPRHYPATDPNKTYALFELIDIAEEQNPKTRAAWEQVKRQATELGIARGALYPTIAINVPVLAQRRFVPFPSLGKSFPSDVITQDETAANPVISLNYLLFDFGERRGNVEAADANLFVAGTALTEAHEQIALTVTTEYYRVISSAGLVEAARSSLKDAETVEQQVQEQLNRGLATLPNLLNARAQREQAAFNLENAVGTEQTTLSSLEAGAGLNPTSSLKVKSISAMPEPYQLEASAEQLIDRALLDRPDLLEAVGEVRAADAAIKAARSSLYPTLSLRAQGGFDSIRTETNFGPAPYVGRPNWTGELSARWTIFDGGRRKYRIIQAESEKRAAQAQLNSARDQAANQVWSAYIAGKVAFRRLDASKALLAAAQTSYDAASLSFTQEMATYTDVLNAERALAQARGEQVQAQAQVLSALAQLAYQTGDLLGSRFLNANRNAK